MFRSKKYITILKNSIVVLWTAVLFSSCLKNNVEQIKAFTHEPGAPEIVADTFELIYSDSAVVRLKLITSKLMIYSDEEEPYQEYPDGLIIERFNGNMQITSRIEAKYGKYHQEKDLWEARYDVVVVTETGDTLKSEELFLDENKNVLYSDQYVKVIRKGGEILSGIGFKSDMQMSEWVFYKPQGTIFVEVNQ